MAGSEGKYLINEVARRVGLSPKRIREYEKEGFIRPSRQSRTNNRLYSEFEVSQIQRINHLLHEKGFTLACLRNLLVMAPCWNIFGCPEPQECPAYHQPHRPCWQVRRQNQTSCQGPCRHCALYLNRKQEKEGVLLRDREGQKGPGP